VFEIIDFASITVDYGRLRWTENLRVDRQMT